jgi:hypothetical protein
VRQRTVTAVQLADTAIFFFVGMVMGDLTETAEVPTNLPVDAQVPTPASVPANAPMPEPPAAKPDPVMLHMPVDVRSVSLFVLAALASIFALHWAAQVFIPLMLSVLLTYALSPLIAWLECRGVSRWASAAVVLLSLAGATGGAGYALSGNVSDLLDALPVASQKLRQALHPEKGSTNTSALDAVQQAAAQLEQVGQESSMKAAAQKGVMRVAVERPHFNVRDYLWSGTVGLLALAGQLTLVAFLTYFALGSGNTFRRKLVKISGASLQKKKITVHVLDDIRTHIERYLLVQIFCQCGGWCGHQSHLLGDRHGQRHRMGRGGGGHQSRSLCGLRGHDGGQQPARLHAIQ